MIRVFLRAGVFLSLLLLAVGYYPAGAEITRKNIRFVEYPDFPDAHSSWGSIGYSSSYRKVYIGVTNHRDKVGLFEYDIESGKIMLCGFLPDLSNLRDFQWQGKMHSQVIEGPDSCMYFSTDGGESRMLHLMDHPLGYGGSFFYRWDPEAGRLDNIGMGPRFDSLKDMMLDRKSGKILATTFPQVHLLLYDPEKNDLRDLGRVGSAHVPRVLFNDRYGNVYYVDWRQRLVKYEHDTEKLLFAEESLPYFEGTPPHSLITGITAWAENQNDGAIYLITYGSKMIAYYPTRLGFGRTEDLGGIYDSGQKRPYDYYCPNLALGDNGMLYYFIGGHGNYVDGVEQNVLMEFDPEKKTKRMVLSFSLKEINEVTGSNVKDAEGNLYFCGRKDDPRAEMMGESGASWPFMIIFNPSERLTP